MTTTTYTTTTEDHEHAMSLLDDFDALMDSVVEASDGCSVEPDGVCQHGRPSPLLVLGVI